jgi:hypothetical protein
MQFNNSFIGYSCPNTIHSFLGGDQEEQYLANLKTQPKDWYYRDNKITYDINKHGHRSRNIEDIDLDNYILFTGCSHTEGVGLELEKTFPYLVANALEMDYYNLGLGGSGIDIMAHNLMVWIHTVKKLPKALVIMWPQTTRFAVLENKVTEIFSLEVPSCTTSSKIEKFMTMGEEIRFFETVSVRSKKLIDTAYDCKIIHPGWEMLGGDDKARDLSHAGIQSNQNVADYLVRQLR